MPPPGGPRPDVTGGAEAPSRRRDQVAPHVFVIVGGTGDLAEKKLLPAVYRLERQGALEGDHLVLAVAREELDDDAYRRFARQALAAAGIPAAGLADWCDARLFYEPVRSDEGYGKVAARLAALEERHGLPGNRVFYLAVPPEAFPDAVRSLAEAGLHEAPGWTRLVVEKPFGRDLTTAADLNALAHRFFAEEQIFRIDHFLGKETVQNLFVFRFANAMFEALWNRDRVESVEITVAESIGIGDRAGFYEGAGALKDMVQNHLTQILALVAMDVPASYDAEAVHYEKLKVLRSVQPLRPEDVVFGQYAAGEVAGQPVAGYLEEEEVDPESRTETYVALRMGIETWRWQGVPFYLRTGKRLPRQLTEIVVVFRRPPVCLFESLNCSDLGEDKLVITLQPDEGFALFFDVKRPGEPLSLENLPLQFRYEEAFGPLPDAYVTLLLDILLGDSTLFVHADLVEEAWRIYEPILRTNLRVHPYPAGSWGPREADRLPARDGNLWNER